MLLVKKLIAIYKQVTSLYMYWIMLFHFLYLFQIHSNENMGGFYFNFEGVSLIFLSFIPVILLVYLVHFYVQSIRSMDDFKNNRVALYGLGAAYHFHARVQFEWDMFKDNIANAFYLESFIYMWQLLETAVFTYVFVFILILLFMEWRYKSISRYAGVIKDWRSVVVVVVLYVGCLVSSIPCYDPISGFLKSIYVYYLKSTVSIDYEIGTYPLMANNGHHFQFFKGDEKKPTVFLIIVESLNESVMHKTTESGQAITPFLNELSNQSLVFKNFYANSIQSARGHLSIFLSLIPSITNKATTQYKDVTSFSLADAMAQNGYDSVIFHAYDLNGFDNVQSFFRNRGFKIETVKPFIQPDDKPYGWRSWGPEDRVFFKRFFDYYDQGNFKSKPMFFSLVTVASHVPFNLMPKERRLLYPDPSSIHQDYANTMHLVDEGIKVFFDELKSRGLYDDSIVIITSNHTIPMGEHGIYHQEAGYYEESFRIPFLIHWPSRIQPQVIDGAFSQMDIAPTILDMIDAKVGSNHFMGNSIFSKEEHPVYLIQPYGKYLSVVRWPHKFLWHGKTGNTVAYNLQDDPNETLNIYKQMPHALKFQFQDDLKTIYLVQKLYKNNSVFNP